MSSTSMRTHQCGELRAELSRIIRVLTKAPELREVSNGALAVAENV